MNLRQFFVGRAIGLLVVLGVVGLVAAFYSFNNYIYEQKQAYAAADHKNAEYFIEGQRVRLKNGVAETAAAPGSASTVTTRYFGNELRTDLDGDRREDVAFIPRRSKVAPARSFTPGAQHQSRLRRVGRPSCWATE